MDLVVEQGSIIEASVDVIVNAANAKGVMAGGVASVIRKAGGLSVESEAMENAPIAVGTALLTSAGKLPFKGVIHASTVSRPAMPVTPDAVYKATMAALRLAREKGFQSVAIPGLGTGIGSVLPEEAAKQMIAACRDVPGNTIELVLLVDVSSSMVEAWRHAIRQGERI